MFFEITKGGKDVDQQARDHFVKQWNHFERSATMNQILYGSNNQLLALDKNNPDYETVCIRTIYLYSQINETDYAKIR